MPSGLESGASMGRLQGKSSWMNEKQQLLTAYMHI
jgi:hypothetical protein